MRPSTQGPIKHILKWVEEQRQSARQALWAEPAKCQKALMLGGKVKAYTDVISHIKGRYRGKLEE